MAIEARLQTLLKSIPEDDTALRSSLQSAYERLVLSDMGNRFKFMSLFPVSMAPILEKYPPAGFGKQI